MLIALTEKVKGTSPDADADRIPEPLTRVPASVDAKDGADVPRTAAVAAAVSAAANRIFALRARAVERVMVPSRWCWAVGISITWGG